MNSVIDVLFSFPNQLHPFLIILTYHPYHFFSLTLSSLYLVVSVSTNYMLTSKVFHLHF